MRAVPKAFAYLRKSSAPTLEEQRRAIERHASDLGCRVVTEFSDPVISETDPVAGRTGFEALLARLEVRTQSKIGFDFKLCTARTSFDAEAHRDHVTERAWRTIGCG